MAPMSLPPLSGQEQSGTATLTEYASKAYIAELGIQIPRGRLVGNLLDAKEAAVAIGFPVALKLQAAALPHKSDAGAVMLDIRDDTQLTHAWAKLQQVGSRYPGLAIDGILIEAMAPRGLEMIVGARRDRDWGPVTLVGLGGIWTEALHDVRILPVGLGLDEIVEEIGRLRAAPLLCGMRGESARDVTALAMVVQRIGLLLAARPDIQEVDLNPVTVYAVGEGVLALDALIVTNTPNGRTTS
jgi:acyl-CoA synthetase (NDP forming)